MKSVLVVILSLMAVPLHAQIRAAARAGVFEGAGEDLVGTIEIDLRGGAWSFAPAYEVIRGGYDQHATHVDLRRFFQFDRSAMWIGAGPTFVNSSAPSSDTTWNVDAGLAWHTHSAWEPFVAARYYKFRMAVFRDIVEANGVVMSFGISRRLR